MQRKKMTDPDNEAVFAWLKHRIFDELTGEVEEHEVVNTFIHDDDQIVILTIDGEVVETTPWHPFYTDAGWENAGDLQPGDLTPVAGRGLRCG